jgi:hypothetical protein
MMTVLLMPPRALIACIHAVRGDGSRGGPRRVAGGRRRLGRHRPHLCAHPAVAAAADGAQPDLDQRRPIPDGAQQAPHRRPRHRVRPGRPRARVVSSIHQLFVRLQS